MKSWHENDGIWAAMAPVLFTTKRLANAAREVDQVIALLGLSGQPTLLDLCCGTGRHSLEFARRGFHVTGVDRTAAYLAEATTVATSETLKAEFIREDMRQFCRPEGFDAAVNLFTSFGYFDDARDERQVAANLYRSLRPGGQLLIDTRGKEVVARNFQHRVWREEDGLMIMEERHVSDDWGRLHCRWIIVSGSHRQECSLSHRLYSAAELVALLTDCGFGHIRAFGDLAGAPYDQNARRLITVAQKPPVVDDPAIEGHPGCGTACTVTPDDGSCASFT